VPRRKRASAVRRDCPQVSASARGHCKPSGARTGVAGFLSTLSRLSTPAGSAHALARRMQSLGYMKLAQLRKIETPADPNRMRGTEAQDAPLNETPAHWRRFRVRYALAAAALFALLCAWLVHGWLNSAQVVSRARLRLVTVSRGHFVRDVAADGTIVAAVSPTLFAIAPGTVSYSVRAGDAVKKGQALASLDSPELANEYQRESATLDSLDAALQRQQIEIRRQIMTSKQQADLAQVAINAALREQKRSQWAWDQRVISERDYQRAIDDVATAKLNFEHARDSAQLERDSLSLDLRTKRLERDRQALVVSSLKERVAQLTVRSPVDGTVANLAVAEKTRVAANAALITVVDLSAFEIEFQVAESYAGEIKRGMSAEITLEGKTVAGLVTAISPEVRQNQVTGRVRFKDSQPARLRQNERAAVRIVLDEREGVLKFERGSFIDEATHAVYVVHGGQALRTPVDLGAASVAEIEVQRGLNAGDSVVTSDTRDLNQAPQFTISN
jgi:HlyD family secretion protein